MAETVRIAVNDEDKIIWPKRCPRCGAKEDLIAVEFKASRESFSYYLVAASVTTESIQSSFLACRQHAFQNEFGIMILKKTAMLFLARCIIYMAFLFIPLVFLNIATKKATFAHYFHETNMPYLMLFGLLGGVLILWARRAASVLPLRLDPNMNVMVIRFSDNSYARDFKRANPQATRKSLTDPIIFFMRPGFWKFVLVVALIVYIYRKV